MESTEEMAITATKRRLSANKCDEISQEASPRASDSIFKLNPKENPLSRDKSDLVGRRILCLPRSFKVPALSPLQISSSLWQQELLDILRGIQLDKSTNFGDTCGDRVRQSVVWCPKHHCKLKDQRDSIELTKIMASRCARGMDTELANPSKRFRSGRSRKNSPQNQENRTSYTVMRNAQQEKRTSVDSNSNRQFVEVTSDKSDCDDSSTNNEPALFDLFCSQCSESKACAMNNPSDGSNENHITKLSSLPWRLGTIRASNSRNLEDENLSLLIEFDLLDWQSRDWYQVHERDRDENNENDDTGDNASHDNSDAKHLGNSPNEFTPREFRDNLGNSLGKASDDGEVSVILEDNRSISPSSLAKDQEQQTNSVKDEGRLLIQRDVTSLSQDIDKTKLHSKSIEFKTGVVSIQSNGSNAHSTTERLPSDFSVLLIEGSICCVRRKHSPIGGDKLWPALFFYPIIDELHLFDADDAQRLCAIEYLDPKDKQRVANKRTICDIEAEMRAEFQSQTTSGSILLIKDKLESNVRTSKTINSMEQTSCCCWSPRVEFVDEGQIFAHEDSLTSCLVPRSNINLLTTSEDSKNLSSLRKFLRLVHCVHSELFKQQSKAEIQQTTPVGTSESDTTSSKITARDEPQESNSENSLLEAVTAFPKLYSLLKEWHLFQDAQSVLGDVCTASLIVGNRIKVYRSSGTTQWYTAVITSYDERERQFTLIDDTVLEEHHEDPTLLEMHLIDDRLIQSLIEGDSTTREGNTTMARRRTQRNNQQRLAFQNAQLSISNSSNNSASAASQHVASGPTTITVSATSKSSRSREAAASLCSNIQNLATPLSPAPSLTSSSASTSLSDASIGHNTNAYVASDNNRQILGLDAGLMRFAEAAKSRPNKRAVDLNATTGHNCGKHSKDGISAFDCISYSNRSLHQSKTESRSPRRQGAMDPENFPSPFNVTPTTVWTTLKSSSSSQSPSSNFFKGATITGRNFLSHRLRLEALTESDTVIVEARSNEKSDNDYMEGNVSEQSTSTNSDFIASSSSSAAATGDSATSMKMHPQTDGCQAKSPCIRDNDKGDEAKEESEERVWMGLLRRRRRRLSMDGHQQRQVSSVVAAVEKKLELGRNEFDADQRADVGRPSVGLEPFASNLGRRPVEASSAPSCSGTLPIERLESAGIGGGGGGNSSSNSDGDSDATVVAVSKRQRGSRGGVAGDAVVAEASNVGGCNSDASNNLAKPKQTGCRFGRGRGSELQWQQQGHGQGQATAAADGDEDECEEEREGEEERQRKKQQLQRRKHRSLPANEDDGDDDDEGSRGKAAAAALALVVELVEGSGSVSDGSVANASKVHQVEAAAAVAAVSRRRSGSCCCCRGSNGSVVDGGSGCSCSGAGEGSGGGGGGSSGNTVEHCDHDNNKQPAAAAAAAAADNDDVDHESGEHRDCNRETSGVGHRISSKSSSGGSNSIEQNNQVRRLPVDERRDNERTLRTRNGVDYDDHNDNKAAQVGREKVDIERSISLLAREKNQSRPVGKSGENFETTHIAFSGSPREFFRGISSPAFAQNVHVIEDNNNNNNNSNNHYPCSHSHLKTEQKFDASEKKNCANYWSFSESKLKINSTEARENPALASSKALAPLTFNWTTVKNEPEEEDNRSREQEEEIGKLIEQIIKKDEVLIDEKARLAPVSSSPQLATRHENYHTTDQFKHQQTSASLNHRNIGPSLANNSDGKPRDTRTTTTIVTPPTAPASVTNSATPGKRRQQRNNNTSSKTTDSRSRLKPELSPADSSIPIISAPIALNLKQQRCSPLVMHNFCPSSVANITTDTNFSKQDIYSTENSEQHQSQQNNNISNDNTNTTSQPVSKSSGGQSKNFRVASQPQHGSYSSQFLSPDYQKQQARNFKQNDPLHANCSQKNISYSMPSSASSTTSSPLIYNSPASKQSQQQVSSSSSSSSLHHSLTNNNNTSSFSSSLAGVSAATSSVGLMSAPSPLTSFYGSTATISNVDTLDNSNSNTNSSSNNSSSNNNISNNNNNCASNLSTKTSALTASHSALTAAVALQSLNQYHLQRSQQLAHQINQHQQLQSQKLTHQSTRSPSNTLNSPSSLHGNTNNMPKLGVTNTTSSNHQNHNHHLALPPISSSNHQHVNDPELAAKFQQQKQLLSNQPPIPAHELRPPLNWQEIQTSMPVSLHNSVGSAGSPRWPYNGNASGVLSGLAANCPPPSMSTSPAATFSNIPGAHNQSPMGLNNFSNNMHMIGRDGDKLIGNGSMRSINNNNNKINDNNSPRQSSMSNQSTQNVPQNPLFDASKLPTNLGLLSNAMNKQNQYQLLDTIRVQNPSIDSTRLDLQRLPDDWEKQADQLTIFTYNLLSTNIPGTNRPKRIVPVGDIRGLRESIFNGEFYTKHQDIALGILSNGIIIPDFNILEYIRRGRHSMSELEKMDYIHKQLGICNLLYLSEIAEQRSFMMQQQQASISAASASSKQSGAITGLNHNDSPLRQLSSDITANNFNSITGIPQHQAINRQQAFKNNSLHFLPPLPGKSDFNPSHVDKGRRSSQSPSDINSRSHLNNVPSQQRMLNSHSSPSQYQHMNLNQTSMFNSSSSAIPPISASHSSVNDQRLQQYSSAVSFQSRSSPFNTPIVQNPHINSTSRPPRSSSAMGPLNMSHYEQGMSSPSLLTRQPPAAHQSSTRPNVAGSSPDIAHTQLSSIHRGPPVSAHMSSKTPLTPGLHTQESLPLPRKPVPNNLTSTRHSDERNKTIGLPLPNSIPIGATKSDHDPMAGLPVQVLLSLKQQQEMAMRRGSTPHVNPSGPYSSSGLEVSRQPNATDIHSGSRSPMNTQVQPIYPNPIGGNSFKSPSSGVSPGNFSSSQANDADQHRAPVDINKFADARTNDRLCNVPIPGETQGKQYSAALLSSYQHQQMLLPNKPVGPTNAMCLSVGMPSPAHAVLHQPQPPLGSPRTMNNLQQSHIVIPSGPQVQQTQLSPKQFNQRSIITGSMSPSTRDGSQKLRPVPQAGETKASVSPINMDVDGRSNTAEQETIRAPGSNVGAALLMTTEHTKMEPRVQTVSVESAVSSINEESPHVIAQNALVHGNAMDNGSVSAGVKSEVKTNNVSENKSDPTSESNTCMQETNSDANTPASVGIGSSTSNANKTSHEPPSKYQKLYCKKAWLKDYDQEDKARSDETAESANQPDKDTEPISKKHIVEKGYVDEKSDNSGNSDKEETSEKVIKTEKSERNHKVKRKVMPKRKVKANMKKRSGESQQTKLPKDGSSKKRTKREKDELVVKREHISDDEATVKRTKKTKIGNSESEASSSLPYSVGEVFLQTDPCYDIVPKSIRCMECRRVRHSNLKNEKNNQSKNSAKSNWDDFCRFYEFRKLECNKDSQLVVAGFSNLLDAEESDMRLWLPNTEQVPRNLNQRSASYIIECIGEVFCDLVKTERKVRQLYNKGDSDNETKKIMWKKAVNELRELCDVCSTTLFNYHYFCERCGFVVCFDCQQEREAKSLRQNSEVEHKTHDGLSTDRESLQGSVDSNANIKDSEENGQSDSKEQQQNVPLVSKKRKKDAHGWIFCAKNEEHSHENLALAQIIAGNCLEKLLELCHQYGQNVTSTECRSCIEGKAPESVDQIESNNDDKSSSTMAEISSWLSNGELLVLKHPRHKFNIKVFRKQWKQCKPVIVRGVDKLMNIEKWLPKFFGEQYGDYRSDLVDCRNGDIHRHSMKKYWDGFEPSNNGAKKKSKDSENSNPIHIPATGVTISDDSSIGACYYTGSALWRLKDWPPGVDFKDVLPTHYEDFMKHLPLAPYTTRSGRLNLACRLPKEMLKPDLGPKMYSAYGTIQFPERGTTNLHLDISDAINVMVYVGGAKLFENGSEDAREMFEKTIEDTIVDDDMKQQIRSEKLVPGALWHIFKPSDAFKLREFLNRIADERQIAPDKRTDPIHDQTWYLDQTLLDRLQEEHGVKSFAILQCMGDAIVIPAGAPHQVKNLQNCIKVANDFVSPENVRQCLKLTDEFRSLPETHINQEDKLQIKNILYHSVKEVIQCLKMSESLEEDVKETPADSEEELNDD